MDVYEYLTRNPDKRVSWEEVEESAWRDFRRENQLLKRGFYSEEEYEE